LKRKSALYKLKETAQNLKPVLTDIQNLPLEIKIQRYRKQLQKKSYVATSWSDHDSYRDFCRIAANHEDIFRLFKRYRSYRAILEHLSKEVGGEYLQIIKNEGEDFLKYFDKFRGNDMAGDPIRYQYDIGKVSPTTLRYIKVLVDLFNRFGSLDGFHIVEIGGGYGGQCKIISDVFHFQSYTIFDLDAVLQLTQKYLSEMNVKDVRFKTLQDADATAPYDLVVSNYAFTECTKPVQDAYIDRVLLNASRGYLTCNYDKKSPDLNKPYDRDYLIQRISETHNPEVLEENPKTGYMNFIMVWDNTTKG
jgi:putative sugar O-methyltransferase